MNKQSTRDIFDNISLNVISFLENHIGISDVDFNERSGKYITSNYPLWPNSDSLQNKTYRCPHKYRKIKIVLQDHFELN